MDSHTPGATSELPQNRPFLRRREVPEVRSSDAQPLEVWWADLGNEAKTRPIIVLRWIGNGKFDYVPVTTKRHHPNEVYIGNWISKGRDSWARCENVRTDWRDCLGEFIGYLEGEPAARVRGATGAGPARVGRAEHTAAGAETVIGEKLREALTQSGKAK